MEDPQKVLFEHEDVVRDIPQAGIFETIRGGVTESRTTVYINPLESNVMNPNDRRTFKLPEDAWTDMKTARIEFAVTYSGDAYARKGTAADNITNGGINFKKIRNCFRQSELKAPLNCYPFSVTLPSNAETSVRGVGTSVTNGLLTVINGITRNIYTDYTAVDSGTSATPGNVGRIPGISDLFSCSYISEKTTAGAFADSPTIVTVNLNKKYFTKRSNVKVLIADAIPNGNNKDLDDVGTTNLLSEDNFLECVFDGEGSFVSPRMPITAGGALNILIFCEETLSNYAVSVAPTVVPQNGALSYFQTMRLKQSSFMPEELNHADQLHRALANLFLDKEWMSIEGGSQGYFDCKVNATDLVGYRLISEATGTRIEPMYKTYFQVRPFGLGIWQPYYLPTSLAKSFYLELVANSMESATMRLGGSNVGTLALPDGNIAVDVVKHNCTKFQLENLRLCVDTIRPYSFYTNAINIQWRNGMLRLNTPTWHHHVLKPVGSTTTLVIQEKANSISHALIMLQHQKDESEHPRDSGIARSSSLPTSTDGNVTSDGNPPTASSAYLKSIQWRIGNFYYPQDKIDHIVELTPAKTILSPTSAIQTIYADAATAEASYVKTGLTKSAASKAWTMLALEKWAADSPYWPAAQKPTCLNDNRWYGYNHNCDNEVTLYNNRSTVQEPEAFYFLTSFERDRGLLSGINTQRAQIDLQLNLNFNTSVADTNCQCFVRYDQVLQFEVNGSVSFFK